MKEEKNIALSIILTIVTCGIYGIFWVIQLNNDAKEYSGDESLPSGGVVVLLTIITCGIYGLFWSYKMGKVIEAAQQKAGVEATDNSILYLVLALVELSIVNYALIQNELNIITRSKNGGGA